MPAAGAWRSTPSRTGCASRPTRRPAIRRARRGDACGAGARVVSAVRPRARGRARARRRRRQSPRRDPPDRAGAGRLRHRGALVGGRAVARRRGGLGAARRPRVRRARPLAQRAARGGARLGRPAGARRRPVRRPAAARRRSRGDVGDRGIPLVRRLGTGHHGQPARPVPLHGADRGGAAHPDDVRALRRPGHAPQRVPRFRGEARIQYRRRRALVRRGGARLSRGDAGRRPGEGAVPGAGGHDRLAREGHALRHRRGRGRRPPARG